MKRRSRIRAIALCAALIASGSLAAAPARFDPQEIRAATTKLIAALEDRDPTAWVYMYTEDAGLLEAGSAPLEGRAALLALARSMQRMSSVVIVPSRIEGDGTIAFMYGRASWVNGEPAQAQTKSQVHLVIVWRKEADGQWRVSQEALVPDAE